MKTLYLHIGTPKTATSSVQRLCVQNNKILHMHGYSFPKMPFEFLYVSKRRNGHFLIQKKRFVGKELEEFNANLAKGFDVLHKGFEMYDNLLLFEENIWLAANYAAKSPIDILKEDAAEHGYAIKVIVYLRRQDGFVNSRWNQLVKACSMTDSLENNIKNIQKKQPLMLDYASAIDLLAEKVGKDNITVRRFDPSSWVNGNIYDDYLDAINFPKDVELERPAKEANLGLRNNFFEIQRIINTNKFITVAEKREYAKSAREVSDATEEHYVYNMLSTEATKDMLDKYREGNDRIAKEYIGDDKPLFNDKVKELPTWESGNSYMTQDILTYLEGLDKEHKDKLFCTMFLSHQAEIEEHKADIKKMQETIDKLCRQNERQQQTIENMMYKFQHPIKAFFKRLFNK